MGAESEPKNQAYFRTALPPHQQTLTNSRFRSPAWDGLGKRAEPWGWSAEVGACEARLRGTASHVLELEVEVGAGGSGEWKA